MPKMKQPLLERLMSHVRVDPDGCWTWTGYKIHNGYGRVKVGGQLMLAHRAAYVEIVGPIPDGLQLDHLCRNRACINPAHLEPVTCRTNLLRGTGFASNNAAKTECSKGHPFDGENLILQSGRRRCLACQRARSRK